MARAIDLLLRYYELGNAASAEADADAAVRADLRAAVDRGDAPAMQAMLDMVDENAEFTAAESGDTVFRGHAGQIQLFEQWLEVMTDWRCEASEFAEGPDGLMFSALVRSRGRSTGIEFEERAWCVARFSGERVVGFHELDSLEAARAAAGLE